MINQPPKKVKRDMCERFAIAPERVVQTGFYRSNLDLSVLSVASQEKLQQLANIIASQQGAGIVYVTLQHPTLLGRVGINKVLNGI